jgi:hypothetical protein
MCIPAERTVLLLLLLLLLQLLLCARHSCRPSGALAGDGSDDGQQHVMLRLLVHARACSGRKRAGEAAGAAAAGEGVGR